MATAERAIVIGGGIGGLTAAAALRLRGLRVTVLERAATLRPVGAAISLAPNALRGLDVIGLGDDIRALAAWQGDGGLRAPGGRWLSRTGAAAAAERFGGPLVLLHRATLVDHLAGRLPDGTVRTGTPARLLDPGVPGDPGRPARVSTSDGELEADLVVAADGIHSAVRRVLFPGHPGVVYSGFTTWRTVIPLPGVTFSSHETWGRGRIWGTHPLKDGRVYAYAAAVRPPGERAPDDERAALLRLFGDWHTPVPELLTAVRPEDVLRHDVHHIDRPLPAFHRGRVALLGDAAHAMPPTLGQGGNQAIEDAVTLAFPRPHAGPSSASPVADDLPGYTAARLPRTAAITRRAVRVARLNLTTSRVAAAVRDHAVAALSKAGPALLLRGFDGVADWRPPGGPADAGGDGDGAPRMLAADHGKPGPEENTP
ncbi:FAD-dependent monooxygenase [Streptomyces sp. NPDC102347]|uniref:FAD-dependent monooxygenase n=1 Tax=Streptomyces sp. NPDC102347 TaxID=3366157 RepID=UPI0037F83097